MILVVGGAGYIGSHMTAYLVQQGCTPLVLDNLSTGHRAAVLDAPLIEGDMADRLLLKKIFTDYPITTVMHFASFIQVGESTQHPEKYYQNNVAATLNLLSVMRQHAVRQFIFSSTAAVYGEPHYTPIDEHHPIAPINPYGHSKQMVEQMLADFSRAYGLQYAVLRYFNAAGADPEGRLAECHEPETHLIPLILQVAQGKRSALTVYGQDYATPDGTCIRDYIHVTDLCTAHWLALQKLTQGATQLTCNLGTGRGYSVRQVLEVARQITQTPIPTLYAARRPGDPAILVADAKRAQQELQWQPRFSDLQTIIQHAWRAQKISIFEP